MNTPTHAVLNLAILNGRGGRTWPVLAGAVGPDLPLVAFYLYERWIAGASEHAIWTDLYFQPQWQVVFDTVHSIPFAIIGFVLATMLVRSGWAALFASVILHCVCDLPLHGEDGHRHFFPFSDYCFVSPVSYWDPRHYGAGAALLELIVMIAASAIVARRMRSRAVSGVLIALCALYLTGYIALYAR